MLGSLTLKDNKGCMNSSPGYCVFFDNKTSDFS